MNGPDAIRNSTALVTGASGFIGSHLVDYLLDQGCAVHCLARQTSNLRWLKNPAVQLHTVDLTGPFDLGDRLKDVDYVFHCAGLTKAKSRLEYFRINTDACARLYRQCLDSGKRLKAIVHLSSLASVGPSLPGQPINEATPCRPLTYYGKSKLAGEENARGYFKDLPIVILRPPVVYGPREEDFFIYLKTLQKGWVFKVGHERRFLSLIYIKDLIRAMMRAAARVDENKRVFFITDGAEYSWEEVAETAGHLLGVQSKDFILPESLLKPAALLSEAFSWLRSSAPLLDRQRVIDLTQSSWTASSQNFFDHYQFLPKYNLEEGLSETLNWYQTNGWL